MPVHKPRPAPVHKPRPTPVHRPKPMPVHKPMPTPTYEEDYDDHNYESTGYNTHDSSYGHDNGYSDKSYGSDYEEDYHQEPSYGRSYEEDSYQHNSYGQSYDSEPSYGDHQGDGGYGSYGQSYDSKPSYEDEEYGHDEGYGSNKRHRRSVEDSYKPEPSYDG